MAPDTARLLSGLNHSQIEAVLAQGGPVVVLAGAGSGKTRVLTRRIAHRVLTGETDPGRVMAVTFTRKAAAELRRRLRRLGLRQEVNAGTFHRLAYTQLRERWAEQGVVPPVLLDNRIRFVGRLLDRPAGPRSPRIDARDVCAELDWARARLVGPEHYEAAAAEAGRTPPLPAEALADLLDRYQREKRRKRVVDFDDLLMLAIRDLRADHGYAEAIRWRYRHLYVDEFQDVNPLQFELLSQWRGDRPDLFVVGDPNQAIYGWNGADPRLLQRFTRRERGAIRIDLTDNYRSSPQILAVAATMATRPLTAHQPDGPVPTITAHSDDVDEAEGVAARIAEARAVAGSWSDQAVLVRTNAQLAVLGRVLRERGVPIRVRAGAGPLAAPEVRAVMADLNHPGVDPVAALEALDERLAGSDDAARSPADIERRANLAALSRLIHEYVTTDPLASGPGLVSWLATLSAGDIDIDGDAVELTTFHGAKGLEWSVVHLAGLEDGFVPIAYATTSEQQDEERRLLYVATTRAREELHLSWAASRTFTTKPVARQPSPHLAALAAVIGGLGPGPRARVDWRAGIERSRASYEAVAGPGTAGRRRSPTPGDELQQVLRGWRDRRARAAAVPPQVVLTDAAIRAIATATPGTRAQLATVPGMTTAKLARFGDDILALVGDHERAANPPSIRVVDQA